MTDQPHVSRQDIEHRFGYHRATFPVDYDIQNPERPLAEYLGAPDAAGNMASAPRHAQVRAVMIEAAEKLVAITGGVSREQSLMLTAMQEASMWANAAVAMESPLVPE